MKSRVVVKKKVKLGIIIFVIVLLSFFLFYLIFSGIENNKKIGKVTVKKYVDNRELSLIMVGDSLIHSSVYEDAKESDGSYNFKKMLENIKPIVKNYDLAFYNQESILGGSSFGLSTYPAFNSPQEVGDAFLDAGFNLVSLANNHTLDRGRNVIYSSLDYWNSKSDIMTAGSYLSEEDRTSVNIMEKNGITYALLSYTTTTNGIPVPGDASYLVDFYDSKKVREDVERLRDKVDLLMVAMHWGEEYNHDTIYEQREIANYLASLGVNIVIGHHPHVVEPIEFIGDTLVIYSLGNFISGQVGIERQTGLMAGVTVKKLTIGEKNFIVLNNPTAELVYTYYREDNDRRYDYKLYPYKELNDDILDGYKEYYDKYMKIVTSKSKRIIPIPLNNN